MATLLGRLTAATSADFNGTPETTAWKFVAVASGNLAVLKAQTKVANPTATAVSLSIWDDSAGGTRPGALLERVNADNLTTARGTGVFQATMAGTTAIVSGITYWLAWASATEAWNFQGDAAGAYVEAPTNPVATPWPSGGNGSGTINAIIWGESASGTDATVTAVPMVGTGDIAAAVVASDGAIIAVPMLATGDVAVPTLAAGSTVIGVVMAAVGDIAANIPITAEVAAVGLVMSGDMGEGATIGGTSDATVVAVPMAATGNLIIGSIGSDQTVIAVPMISSADLVAAAVTADSIVVAVPMAALGDVAVAALTSGSNVGATIMLATGDMAIPAIIIDGVPVGSNVILTLALMGVGS